MRKIIIAALLSAVAGTSGAAQQIIPAQSQINFSIRQMGVTVEGRFKKFSADVNFDRTKPQAGHIQIGIETGSAGFGSPELDVEVPKAVWLDASRFPKAVFRSSSIRQTGPDTFDVIGKLSLKGIERDMTVPVKIAPSGNVMVATGALAIKRLDYKVGEGEWSDTSMVANEVQIKFSLAVGGTP